MYIFDPRRLLSKTGAYQALQSRLRRDETSRRLVDEVLRIEPGQRVLDIGCGPADMLALLPDSTAYYGLDAEPNYIAAARERYGDRGTFDVRMVSPDAVSGFGRFDVVMVLAVLHHLSDAEVQTLFSAASSLLEPNGRFITLTAPSFSGSIRSPDCWPRWIRGSMCAAQRLARHWQNPISGKWQ